MTTLKSRLMFVCGGVLVFFAAILVLLRIDEGWQTRAIPQLLPPENWPVTVEEAVHDLVPRMSRYETFQVLFTKKDELYQLHFGLGMRIRNQYGLWRGNEKLTLSACGFRCHPDEASMKIIASLWKALH